MGLEDYRKELDIIDKQLEECFVRRMGVAARIAEYKRLNGIPTYDPARETKVVEMHCSGMAEELKPNGTQFFIELMRLTKEYQEALKAEKETDLTHNY